MCSGHPRVQRAARVLQSVPLRMLLSLLLVTAASHMPWASPVGGAILVQSPFHLPNGPFQAGHRGIDLVGKPGDAVFSPAFGTVTFVGTVVDRPVVSLRTDAQTVVSLEPVASTRVVGDQVRRGQTIGMIAEGGHCAQSCLHLGVRIDDEYVNPLRFFFRAPVLLPW